MPQKLSCLSTLLNESGVGGNIPKLVSTLRKCLSKAHLRGIPGFHHLHPIKWLKDLTILENSPRIPDKEEQAKLNAYDLGSLGQRCIQNQHVSVEDITTRSQERSEQTRFIASSTNAS